MTETERPIRVRFAPSPTGRLHLGSGRTALYDYLIAKKLGGQFILRIEDTDRNRYVPGAEKEIIDGLHWLGIDWDEGPDKGGPYGPYRQSERKEIYLKEAERLIEQGDAYYCFCTQERLQEMREKQQQNKEFPHYDGCCRNIDLSEAKRRVAAGEPHVIRFKTPKEGTTTVTDLLRGEITVENKTIEDYVIVKSDGWALYHLAAAVDDHLMKITHVIRSSEWLSTLPLHHMIHKALGWEEPIWVHLSVFLKPSGKGKMSKRDSEDMMKNGYSIFITDLQELGYLPEGVVNWAALMGWSYDDHTEYFTMKDLEEKFSLEHLNPSPAAINFSKLDHFNGMHIRTLPIDELAEKIQPFFTEAGIKTDLPTLRKIAPIIQERLVVLGDAVDFAGFFFAEDIPPVMEQLLQKGLDAKGCADVAARSYDVLSKLSVINAETAEEPMRQLIEEMGLKPGQVFGVLRGAISGQKVTPPLFESMEIIGRDKVLERIKTAEMFLRENA